MSPPSSKTDTAKDEAKGDKLDAVLAKASAAVLRSQAIIPSLAALQTTSTTDDPLYKSVNDVLGELGLRRSAPEEDDEINHPSNKARVVDDRKFQAEQADQSDANSARIRPKRQPRAKTRAEREDDAKYNLRNKLTSVAGQLEQNPTLTEEEAQLAAKKEYNRRNGLRARKRFKYRLHELQEMCSTLVKCNEELTTENERLRIQIKKIRDRDTDSPMEPIRNQQVFGRSLPQHDNGGAELPYVGATPVNPLAETVPAVSSSLDNIYQQQQHLLQDQLVLVQQRMQQQQQQQQRQQQLTGRVPAPVSSETASRFNRQERPNAGTLRERPNPSIAEFMAADGGASSFCSSGSNINQDNDREIHALRSQVLVQQPPQIVGSPPQLDRRSPLLQQLLLQQQPQLQLQSPHRQQAHSTTAAVPHPIVASAAATARTTTTRTTEAEPQQQVQDLLVLVLQQAMRNNNQPSNGTTSAPSPSTPP